MPNAGAVGLLKSQLSTAFAKNNETAQIVKCYLADDVQHPIVREAFKNKALQFPFHLYNAIDALASEDSIYAADGPLHPDYRRCRKSEIL